MAAVICRSAKQSIIGFRKKLFVGMKTYHVLKIMFLLKFQ